MLTVGDGRITEVTAFVDPIHHDRFGLPRVASVTFLPPLVRELPASVVRERLPTPFAGGKVNCYLLPIRR